MHFHAYGCFTMVTHATNQSLHWLLSCHTPDIGTVVLYSPRAAWMWHSSPCYNIDNIDSVTESILSMVITST